MSNHTPGEWRLSGKSVVTDDYCIAVIEDDGGYEAPAEQREANERLLLASPKLLAACKQALARMRIAHDHSPFKFSMEIQNCAEAVAQAEGEQP